MGNCWYADEAPLCQIIEGTVSSPIACTCSRAKSLSANFCKGDPSKPNSCSRYDEFNALDGQVRLPSSLCLLPAQQQGLTLRTVQGMQGDCSCLCQ